jgi:hypothetical protein
VRQLIVSVPRGAYRSWIKETRSPDEPARIGEKLQLVRTLVNREWSKRETYFCEKYGEFWAVPVTSSLWALCSKDKRPWPSVSGDRVVVQIVVPYGFVESRIQRCQWEHVETA